MDDLEKNARNSIGRFVMWANCNIGELQYGRISIRPYNVHKHTHTMPMMLFVYLHVYLRTSRKHTCRGLIAISPPKWVNCNIGEFATRVNCNVGEFATKANCITYSAAPARGLCPYDTRKQIHTMPVMLFLCIYMYLHICERPENTRVGANCN